MKHHHIFQAILYRMKIWVLEADNIKNPTYSDNKHYLGRILTRSMYLLQGNWCCNYHVYQLPNYVCPLRRKARRLSYLRNIAS